MIIDLILNLLEGILKILLSPLDLINITIDFTSNFSFISDFFSVIAYILPWENILPIISIVVGIFIFKAGISLIRVILSVIPLF